MARKRKFNRDDLSPVEELYEELRRPLSLWQRFTNSRRSLQIEPSGRRSGVGVTITAGNDEVRVIASPVGHEPGEEVAPLLAQRGLDTPSGWSLMVDIGTAVGWAAPAGSSLDEVLGHALAAIETLGGAPEDGAWTARLVVRRPRERGRGRRL